MTTPTEGFERLRAAERDGALAAFAEHHGLSLIVVFGSTARGEESPHDLDVAVASRGDGVDVIAVITALIELTGADVDLLDLDRAGPVARQHALVGGEPLYEHERGDFVRRQLAASGERLSTEWMRRRSLARMAES